MVFCMLPEVLIKPLALAITLPILAAAAEEDGTRWDRPGASDWVNCRMRRALDCTVAALALLLLLPVLAICWVLVRFTSPGPVLFRQRRMGREGRVFEIYKFRSMRIDRHVCGRSHTVHRDERLTRVGAMLRRCKLDEAPQFWNVLKGDMSLVGPRPKLPNHEALHMPYRPGLTGEATLAFRHEERMLLEIPPDGLESFYDAVLKPIKAYLDIVYMQRATCASDLRMLVRTFFRCLSCARGARRELAALLEEYAPESLSELCPLDESGKLSSRGAPAFLSELMDEFATEMDDV